MISKTLKLYNGTLKKIQRKKKTKEKKKPIKVKTQKGGALEWRIKSLQSQINKNILYDEYDWTKTFQPKQIGDSTYNHLLGLNNPELMTQNYFDLLTFVNKSISKFKLASNTETVKMYLVKEEKLSKEEKAELQEQEQSYKDKYTLELGEPVDLVEGMVIPRKDDTIYFEELDNQFTTMRDFLEERKTNLEECIIKEKKENDTDGPNTEYFQHEITSCSELIEKYDNIEDKRNNQALLEFVGKISDTLYYNKVFYELNRETVRDLFTLTLEGIDEIEIRLLKTFIPLQFFDENNNIKLEDLKSFLLNPENKYFYQQFIYGITTIRNKYYKFPYNSSNNEANKQIKWFAPHNEMYKAENNCNDFVYWSLKFNNYFMYLSTFSNVKLFPSRYVLPIDYKYSSYEQLKLNIDESTLSDEIKSIIKEKETFAFAVSNYQGQLFNPLDINKLQFVGCLMIKFQKQIGRKTIDRIWILFYFKNMDFYESNVTGKKYKFVSCSINLFITDNTNITYRQLVSYKELKQYYYYSINEDKNTNTKLSFYRYDITGLTPELQNKYKHILLVTRHNNDNKELKRVTSECNLVKVELKLLGEKDEKFRDEKYKYGITGDIFYLE
jgi:hypothetical protein